MVGIMANRTRAERRHHYNRLKAYHRKRLLWWWDEVLPDEIIASYATTGTKCSCWMCGNPRRHHGQITHQELIARLNHIEGCETANVHCNMNRKQLRFEQYY
jgi:hypothetical protein